MVKLLSIIVLILSIILFPPASLALVSNNAVPGDKTYPIKRGLEDVIYAIASLNSTSKAWFSKARSDRRFEEIKLLAFQEKSTTNTLDELVSQADTAVSEIDKVESASQKKELLKNVQQSIEKYDQGLKELSEKVSEDSAVEIPKQSSEKLKPTQSTTRTSKQQQEEEKEPEPVVNQPPVVTGPSQEELEKKKQEYEEAIKRLEEIAKKAREAQEAAEKLLKQQQQQQNKDKKRQKENEGSSTNQQSPPDTTSQQQADNSQTQQQSSVPASSDRPTQGVAGYLDLGNGPVFSEDDTSSSDANCKSDCDACPSQTVCGEKTYDTCEDNFGRKSTTSTFCSGDATHFRCYAKDNIACRSIDPNDQNREFIYPCSTCNISPPTSTTSSPSSPPAPASSSPPIEYYPDEE